MSSLGIFDKETKTYKKVADLSKPAVIDSSMSDTSTNAVQNKVVKSYVDTRTTVDSGMSDTSTNPVQNKAVKSYVDGRTTLDTAMSDNSTKAVQNKVVKSYVDTRTTFDSAMSDTSTNAVQNKIVKSYVDTRTTLDTSMSDSSTKAVQNKVVKSYVDGTFRQKLLAQMPGDGKTGYCQLCTIKISKNYVDRPVEITVQERGRATVDKLTILFSSVNNMDPNLASFKVFGEFGNWYISKRANSTWVIYGQKNESWSDIRVVDYIGIDGVNVAWDVTGVTALPDSKTKAVWGGNVNYAVSADRANSVAWNNVTGKPSTYTPSSHTHTKSQITDFPSSLPANGGNASTVNGHTVNSDVPSGAKFTDTDTWRPLGTTADTACAGNDSRLSNARPASDVYAWAKASSKPSYNWNEITNKPTSFSPYFANDTWYAVGDDAYIGDHNKAGGLGIRGANGNTSLDFCQSDNNSNFKSITFDGTTLYMDGNCYYASQSGNADTLDGNHASSFATASHTHNYAGSSSAGGSANSAVKLDTATAGSATQPVYFSGGKPVACSYTLGKSVPSNALFTDTNTWRGIQDNLTSSSTSDSLSANQGRVLKSLVDGKAASDHTHNYSYIYLKFTTVNVSPSSTVDIWHSGMPNSEKKLILFTASTGYSYHINIVWFYNGKLYTPDFSSSVGRDKTLNNFTCTIFHGSYYVKYNNTETNTSSSSSAAHVKCYDFMG